MISSLDLNNNSNILTSLLSLKHNNSRNFSIFDDFSHQKNIEKIIIFSINSTKKNYKENLGILNKSQIFKNFYEKNEKNNEILLNIEENNEELLKKFKRENDMFHRQIKKIMVYLRGIGKRRNVINNTVRFSMKKLERIFRNTY